MFKRGFVVPACGALALLLTAVGTSPAQVVFFNGGRNGTFFWPGLSYPVGPLYANYPRPFYYNPPPTSLTSFAPYTMTTPTPIYYGAATPMYYGTPSYSTGRLVSPPPGTGLAPAANVNEAAYAAPTYPFESPDYSVRYPVSPPLAAVIDDTARVEVRLPADAELWFEGRKTSQTGTDRTFRTPELEPAQDYVYEVRARWEANGKPVDETRKVAVHAGDHVVVEFMPK